MNLAKAIKAKNPVQNQQGSSAVVGLAMLAAVSAITYFGATNHCVMTDQGMKLYPKKQLTFTDSYVDMRHMSVADIYQHRELVAVMGSKGDLHLIPGGRTVQRMNQAAVSVARSATHIDKQYQISNSAKQINRVTRKKYSELDRQYDLKGKATKANEHIKDGARKFNQWLKKQ